MSGPEVPGLQVGVRLAGGGHASVWEAGAGRLVKIAHRSTAVAARSFEREAEALRAVGPPHVPRIFGEGRLQGGRPYLVLERLEGRTLREMLAGLSVPPPVEEVARVGRAVLHALSHVHEAGLVHGDLKPANLVWDDARARVTILDLGLARRQGDDRIQGGTPDYMAPEQLAAQGSCDPRSDLYAFGVLLFELCTLERPFSGSSAALELAHRALRPPRPSARAASASPFDDIVLACLAKRPEERLASARHVLARLEETRWDASPAREPPVRLRPPAGDLQPAVLLQAAGPRVAELAMRHRGALAHRHAGAWVFAFTAMTADDPVGAAAAAAVDAGSLDLKVALHVDSVMARATARGGVAFYGAALEAPERWRPGRWEGMAMTGAAERALAGRLAGGAPVPEPGLHGRDDLLARAEVSMRRALTGAAHGLCLAIGEPGVGKSRVARELAGLARRIAPGATVLLAPSPPLSFAALVERARAGGLVLIVDDAHALAPSDLTTIEELAAEALPIWAALAALPRLLELQPSLATRADLRLEVEPLSTEVAVELCRELLAPVDYAPADVFRRLAAWSGGVPLYLVELCAALRRRGMIRRRPNGRGWFVETAELDGLAREPAAMWIAGRRLAALPDELAQLARLCAALGPSFSRAAADALEDLHPLDSGTGLSALAREGLLRSADGRWSFAQPALHAALCSLVSPEERRRAHEIALAHFRAAVAAGDDSALEGVAHHADACGRAGEAAAAQLVRARRARALHRDAEAEVLYCEALRHLSDADDSWCAALAGRGSVRYRVGRIAEAVADLQAARRAARDDDVRADLLLEEATALDWAEHYEASAARVEEAATLMTGREGPRLVARLHLGRARSIYRRGDLDRARTALEAAARECTAVGDEEGRIIALVLLGSAQTFTKAHDEAERTFATALELAAARGDRLHTCVALCNRTLIGHARGHVATVVADLRRAIALAREIGQPMLERGPTHNLADMLLASAEELEEAERLARRSLDLHMRYGEHPVADDGLLLCRILYARGRIDEAERALSDVAARHRRAEQRPAVALMWEAVDAVRTDAGATTWRSLLHRAAGLLSGGDLLQILYWWGVAAARAGDRGAAAEVRSVAAPLLDGWPVWRRRFASLG